MSPTDRPKLDDAALRRLIADAAKAIGDEDPDRLPHMVRQRLQGQLSGEHDIARILKDLERERRGGR